MPHETKAQKEARRMQESAAQMEADRLQYPKMLMESLERASTDNWNLAVEENRFVVRQGNNDYEWQFTYAYSVESMDYLYQLVGELDWQESLREKERERQKVAFRESALAKLSAEEKAALGL